MCERCHGCTVKSITPGQGTTHMNGRIVATEIAIIGGGLAGMSLLAHLGASGWRGDVIVIDDGAYPIETRCWSWWSRGELLLDDSATAAYLAARCASDTWVKVGSLEPYAYRTITGAALSETVSALICDRVRVTRLSGTAVAVSRSDDGAVCSVETTDGTVWVRAERVYDSVGIGRHHHNATSLPRLDFIGWKVHAETAVFTPEVMTLMDFRTDQSNGLAFVYVLPVGSHDALIDHTVYVTDAAATPVDHERLTRDYLATVYGSFDVTLVKVEEGPIPLDEPRVQSSAATLIGVAAGAVKLSTGYGFARIQRHCGAIADAVAAGEPDPPPPQSRGLARLLDRILLGIIHAQPGAAQTMFEAFVRRLDWEHLLAFLDEDASLRDQLRVCVRVPPTVFVRAAFGRPRRRSQALATAPGSSATLPAGERVTDGVEG